VTVPAFDGNANCVAPPTPPEPPEPPTPPEPPEPPAPPEPPTPPEPPDVPVGPEPPGWSEPTPPVQLGPPSPAAIREQTVPLPEDESGPDEVRTALPNTGPASALTALAGAALVGSGALLVRRAPAVRRGLLR
jgi:LPXTG-motif cell wall-anchored protein